MRLKLTQRVVDTIKPSAEGPHTLYWDTEVTGLLLTVYKSGRRHYFFQYATGASARRRAPLGDAKALTLFQAREAALALRVQTSQGVDPLAEREAAAAAHDATERAQTARRFGPLMLTYLAEKERKHKRAPRTVEEQVRLYRREIAPTFAERQADSIARKEIRQLHNAMAERPVLANRTIFLLRSFFTWAMREDHLPEVVNPAAGITLYPEAPRERRVTATEAKRLRRAWEIEQRHRGAGDASVDVLAFLGLTGWRKREGFGLRWDQVNLETGDVSLSHAKGGRSDRWLSHEAIALLKARPRIVGSPFVFASPSNPDKPLADPRATWDALRERARVADVTLHDIRRQFASTALDIGVPYEIRQLLMGHRVEGMTAQYSLPDPRILRDWADRVSARLLERYRYGVHAAPRADVRPIAAGRQARVHRQSLQQAVDAR